MNDSRTSTYDAGKTPAKGVPGTRINPSPVLEKQISLESCEVTIACPSLGITSWEQEGTLFQRLSLPRATVTEEIGKPEAPFFVLHFAIPLDRQTAKPAKATIKVEPSHIKTFVGLVPYPAQPPDWLEEKSTIGFEQERPPFEIDKACYAQPAPYPGQVVEQETFQMGNLHVLRLRVFPIQCYPAKERVEHARRLRVKVLFQSKGDLMAPAILGDYSGRQEPGVEEWVLSALINTETISIMDHRHLAGPLSRPDSQLLADGPFDMLIVTRSALLEQAARLARWRQSQGIRVFLASLDETEYPDWESIRDYIVGQDALNILPYRVRHLRVMTSILIFGDAEIIPPCRGMNVRGREPDPILGVSIVGTDVSYSMLRGPDRVPDVAIGRISVDDAAQAEAVVDKIIRYESRDPEDHPEHMAIYSYFQDDTQIYADLEGEVEFTANSRTVQGHETHFLGQFDPATFTDYIRINSEPPTSWARVDRVISDTELELVQRFGGSEDLRGEAQVGYRDGRADWRFLSGAERVRLFMEDRWVTVRFGYTRSRGPTPTHMYDGRMLPHELAAYHWNATTAELRGNWRQGLDGIILHVDHGYRSGWSDPPLDWANIFNPAVPILGEMHNPDDAFYPIVLSINCSSGHFDNETDERRWIDGAVTSDTTTAPLGECFCERMLRHRDGGAVAAVGAARNSGARLNDKFIDGLLGGFYADYAYGSLITSEIREPILRLGPAVSWAKFHLHSCATDPVRRDYNMEIYHLFGDPMLQMNLPAPYREWRTPPIPR